MHFLITGGSGFIGSRLTQKLIKNNHQVTILTRNIKQKYNPLINKAQLIDSLGKPKENYDVIINLAGESIAHGRWTQQKKKRIFESRIRITEKLINYMDQQEKKPQLLISSSAIGYYGNNGNKAFVETSQPKNNSFTHTLCNTWEQTAYKAKKQKVRVCCVRTGLVLDCNGGLLAQILPSFKFYLGSSLGNGKQWMSWIHIDDLIGLFEHIIFHKDIEGPINATAPYPVTNKEFSKTLGKVIHRPSFFAIPPWILKFSFGEMGETLFLKGQKVLPQKALDTGYQFKYTELEEALKNIMLHRL